MPPSSGVEAASPADYDELGRAKLPPIYAGWFASEQNLRQQELAMDEAAENNIALEIRSPRNDTTILIDPEIPGKNSEILLVTNLPAYVTWSCKSLEIEGNVARLVPGVHTFIAKDSRDGKEHRVTVTVRKL